MLVAVCWQCLTISSRLDGHSPDICCINASMGTVGGTHTALPRLSVGRRDSVVWAGVCRPWAEVG